MSKSISSLKFEKSPTLSKCESLWNWQKILENSLVTSNYFPQTEDYNRLFHEAQEEVQDAYNMGEITEYQAVLLSFAMGLNIKIK